MILKTRLADKTFVIFNTIFLLLISFLCLYPILYIVAVSFSGAEAVMANRVWLFPVKFNLHSYELVFNNPFIWKSYLNTIVYTIVGTAFKLVIITMAAYPLSKKRLMGRRAVSFYFVFTTLFSGGIIPSYLIVKELGWINHIWALVVPGAMSVFYFIILRTHFEQIPVELEEAAIIDGVGNAGILFWIYIPLSTAMYAALTLFFAVGQWNSFFTALIYLNEKSKFPLQVVLREIVIASSMTDMGNTMGSKVLKDKLVVSDTLKSATIIIVMLPIMMIYPFVQKYFVKGMMVGAIKG